MAHSNSFFKRSLVLASTLTSVTTAVTSAHALNLANFSYSDWQSKSTSVGSFGAGYGAGITADFTSGALIGKGWGNADIQIFDSKVRIVDLSATANINDSSSDGASLTAKVVGVTVYTKSFSDGYTFDASKDIQNYEDTFCTEFFDESKTFTVYEVPITVSAGAQGCANLEFKATPQYVTSTHLGTLNMEVTPSLNVDLTAAAGVGISGFSAGVEGTVTLLDVGMPVTLDPSYNFSTSAFSYESTGTANLDMLDGGIGVYVMAGVKLKKTLFDWDGISQSWTLWSTGKPTAGSPSLAIAGATATGAYVYADTAGTSEGSSTYQWYQSSTSSGSGTAISGATGKTRTIVESDKDQYLKFCVTPKNSAGTEGDPQCSDWESVGKVAVFYKNNSYGGASIAVAYEKSQSGTCVNLDDYGGYGDNVTSSYKFFAPSSSQGTINLYKGYDCTNLPGSDGFNTHTVAALGSYVDPNLPDSWNDRLTSIMVSFGESVTAEDVSVDISGPKASAAYTFDVGNSANATESGSTYVWKRASSSSGSSPTTLSATGSSYLLTADDDQKYLSVCVAPSNGNTTGPQACSPWTAVGRLITFRNNAGNNTCSIAWEKSPQLTCWNVSDCNFDNKAHAFNWANNPYGTATLTVYMGSDCGSSTSDTLTSSSGISTDQTMNGAFSGGDWEDKLSSLKIDWTSSVSISTPAVSVSGNKATESHTYSDSAGRSEAARYTWYRASNSSGSGRAVIQNALGKTYTLDPADNNKYLQTCVLSSNGIRVATTEKCSSWTSVGPVAQLFADSGATGASIVIAYSKSPSGTCFNLADFAFDDILSSTKLTAPAGGSATQLNYKDKDCAGTVENHTTAAGQTDLYNTNGAGIEHKSSFKVTY